MSIQPLYRIQDSQCELAQPGSSRIEGVLDPVGPALPQGSWRGKIWVSDEHLSEQMVYRRQVAAFEQSGLWPILIPQDARFEGCNEDWLLHRGRLAPAQHKIASHDPSQVLERWWDSRCCGGDCLRPFEAGFPGIARPGWMRTSRRQDPFAEAGNTGSVLVSRGVYRLGMVSAARPADIPAVLGWTGMVKATDEVAALSAVLRSWEDRFGATLISLGFDELTLSVAAPPRDFSRALRLAAEHRAFSLPTFTRQPGDLRQFAQGLIHRRHWRFSWA